MGLEVLEELVELFHGAVDVVVEGVVVHQLAHGAFAVFNTLGDLIQVGDGLLGVVDEGVDMTLGDGVGDVVEVVDDGVDLRGGVVEGGGQLVEFGDDIGHFGFVIGQQTVEVLGGGFQVDEGALEHEGAVLVVAGPEGLAQGDADGIDRGEDTL